MEFFKIARAQKGVELDGGEQFVLEEFSAPNVLCFEEDLQKSGLMGSDASGDGTDETIAVGPVEEWDAEKRAVVDKWRPKMLAHPVGPPLERKLFESEDRCLVNFQLSLNGHWARLGERRRFAKLRTSSPNVTLASLAGIGSGN